MTVFLNELRMNKLSFIIWTSALSFMLGICVLIYPEMASQMTEMNDMFAEMGSFSSAFGMDKISFGEFSGYFVIECGNVLGIGGAIFASILGVSALYKEEREKTAEFLLTHPISKRRVISEKLLAVVSMIIVMNVVIICINLLCMLAVGESITFGTLMLLLLAYLTMQLEIASVTFCISAFVKKAGLGIGIGLSLASYFLNIISNLTDGLKVLKYITPFGYTDGASILSSGSLEWKYLIPGIVISAVSIFFAYRHYEKKDILT